MLKAGKHEIIDPISPCFENKVKTFCCSSETAFAIVTVTVAVVFCFYLNLNRNIEKCFYFLESTAYEFSLPDASMNHFMTCLQMLSSR